MDSSTTPGDFGIVDYILLSALLLLSLAIGIYYGCTGSKQKTATEFLLGGKQMGALPVGISLIASFMSAAALLGIPPEIYTFGTQFIFMVFGYFMVMPIVCYLFLPVYYDLGITSIYEYLERRYNKIIRKMAAFVFIVQMCLYLAVVVYAPSLALSQVIGLNLWISVIIIMGICTVYTALGGIKAVMWTDVLQSFFMFLSMFLIMILGCNQLGISNIWQKNLENGRLEFFNYSFDPRTRHSVWTQTIGTIFTWLPVNAVNQAQVQRYLSTPSINVARKALWGNVFGTVWNCIICSIVGLVAYAKYWDCDPLLSHKITRSDQLLPYLTKELFQSLPGLTGIFVAGIVSGSLSTLSSGLNSLAAVVLEDFIRDTRWKNMTDEQAGLVAKLIAAAFGIICLLCVTFIGFFPSISQAVLGLFGIGAPILGIFILGMFCPWTNTLGAGISLITGFVYILWITIGALITNPPLPFLPVSLQGCNTTLNDTISYNYSTITYSRPIVNSTSIFYPLYSISYMWYSFTTCIVVVVSGLIISVATGRRNYNDFNPELFSPLVRKFNKKSDDEPKNSSIALKSMKRNTVY